MIHQPDTCGLLLQSGVAQLGCYLRRKKPSTSKHFQISKNHQHMLCAYGGCTRRSDPKGERWYGHQSATIEQLIEAICVNAEDAPEGQTTWVNAGSSDGTANETGPSISTQEFYTSGKNGQFTIINGAYQPIISMTVRDPPNY